MTSGSPRALALTARVAFLESLSKGAGALVQACYEGARLLASQTAEPALRTRRQHLVLDLPPVLLKWTTALERRIRTALSDVRLGRPLSPSRQSDTAPGVPLDLSLVEDSDMERDLAVSRLAQALRDVGGEQYTDLQARLQSLGQTTGQSVLQGPASQFDAMAASQPSDVLHPHWVARWVVESWQSAGMTLAQWATLQNVIHHEAAVWAQEAWHHANRVLLNHGVRPEIDLRPFIRRAPDTGVAGLSRPAPFDPAATVAGAFDAPGGGAGAPSGYRSGSGALYGAGFGGRAAGAGGTGSSASTAGGAQGGASAAAQAGGARLSQGPSGRYGPPLGASSGASGEASGHPAGATGASRGAAGPGGPGGRASGASGTHGGSGASGTAGAPRLPGPAGSDFASDSGLQPLTRPYDETHLLTGSSWLARSPAQSEAVLRELNRAVARQVPGFDAAVSRRMPATVSPSLSLAIDTATEVVRRHADLSLGLPTGSPAALLQDLQQSKQALKKAAASPTERATIEIVALLFQAILMEERLPASIRVWFARLQMPVLRVAVGEPDFFAAGNHPARVLIDRMGACVMGFVGGAQEHDDNLHREIKRIVQVVEAYPDTGRRVFQTVLTEFERFLERYFREQNQASRKGVSLAQQVEQRETWAIQYTIELRKMLDGMPVHEGVRDFLFKVWADVLAHSAVQTSQSSDETRALKRAAADLIWSASAKTSREERADVLMRLPPLLKTLREGMARAGLPTDKQDQHIQALNTALAAAFSARSAAISSAHLQAVTERLETLDQMLPDLGQIELDEKTLRDLSGHETDELEIVAEGGTMPTPAMLNWARELHVGAWFQLDYRGRHDKVQLAWQGLQKQLILFVSPAGRGVLFQLHRLAAFLQAGLLIPLEDEPLTARATREALAKIDADPARLLS